jgi:phage gpG-like protein
VTARVKVKPDELRVLTRSLSREQTEEILDGLGAVLTSRFQKSFREQKSPDGTPWPERMTPNVAGIVKDLNNGGDPKSRRFQGTPAVRDTGILANSLTWEVEGSKLVVGTSIDYASAHNTGAETHTLTLTPGGRRRLAIWLRTLTRDERKDLGLGWLFSQPSFEITPRKRTFVEIGADEKRLIREHVAEEVVRLVQHG